LERYFVGRTKAAGKGSKIVTQKSARHRPLELWPCLVTWGMAEAAFLKAPAMVMPPWHGPEGGDEIDRCLH
jgi:hypothetical protein